MLILEVLAQFFHCPTASFEGAEVISSRVSVWLDRSSGVQTWLGLPFFSVTETNLPRERGSPYVSEWKEK